LRDEAADWLLRLQASPGDGDVRAGLEAWLAASESHRRAYRSVERVWRVSAALPVVDPAELPAIPSRRVGRTRRAVALAGFALVACLAFYLFPLVQLRLQADHMTSVAELRTLTLEDGTSVQLDAESAVAVRYEAGRREIVLLAGQAFFEVVPAQDRPFVVTAGDVSVTVTGTAFDVRSYGDSVTVGVQSGTVEVRVDHGTRLAATLTRGERLRVSGTGREIAKSEIAPEDVASWRERRLIVDGATLGEVVAELDRHHPGLIVVRDRTLGERRITGVFDLRHPVEALQAVARTQQASVVEITPYLLIVSPR
jgi:transmembrane sensor